MAKTPAQQMFQYLDFDIQIDKGEGDQYSVSVHSQGGDANLSIVFPFTANDLDRYLDKLEIALLRSGKVQRQISEEEVQVREFGEKLFKSIFTQDIRSCYDRSLAMADSQQDTGLRIRLDIQADELSTLPWEFLFDPDRDFLCLSAHTPIVRYLDCGQIIRPMEVELPLQVLGMVSSPSDLDALDVAREKSTLEKALAPLIQRGIATLTWLEDGSWRGLLDALNRGPWHIFHFIGHGDYDEQTGESVVVFEGNFKRAQYINASQLARLLGEHSNLRLAVLNSCESGQSGKGNIFSSTAATLLKRGLPAVIAMQYSISDQAAIELSQTFYKCLAAGLPVDAAISRARLAISFAIKNTLEWGTPVLFMRTEDGLLFDLKPTAEAEIAEKIVEKAEVVATLDLQTSVQRAIQEKDWTLAAKHLDTLVASGVDGQDMAAALRDQLDAEVQAQEERINLVKKDINAAIKAYEWNIAEEHLEWLEGEGSTGQETIAKLKKQINAARRKQARLIAEAQEKADQAILNQDWQMLEAALETLNGLGQAGQMVVEESPQYRIPKQQVDASTVETADAGKRVTARRLGIGILAFFFLAILAYFSYHAIEDYENKVQRTNYYNMVASETALAASFTRTPTQAPTLLGTIDHEGLGIVSTRISPIDGMVLIYIHAGSFQMGSETGNTNELPVHTVSLEAFLMDQTEVTNAMYANFLNKVGNRSEGGSTWLKIDEYYKYGRIHQVDEVWQVEDGYADHPASGITWFGARAYCAWVGRQLPSEAQWEYAARGTDARNYPWGEGINCSLANYSGCIGDTTPVGSYPEAGSPFGVLDMAGNVKEWVMDWYKGDYYYASIKHDPQGPETGTSRIQRGGDWKSVAVTQRTTIRSFLEPNEVTAYTTGFRCAHSIAHETDLSSTKTATPSSTPTTTGSPSTTPPPEVTVTATATPTRTSTRTATPVPVIGSTRLAPKDQMVLMYVPAGSFNMGCDTCQRPDESPVHQVSLDAFWMDQTEVTNAMYVAFLNAMGNRSEEGEIWLAEDINSRRISQVNEEWQVASDYENHPVIGVTWYGARDYCVWAGRQLPSEAQWEYVARGTDGRTYPWGNNKSPDDCDLVLANYPGCVRNTAPVGSYPEGASPFKVLDMAGNVWEWVGDWYDKNYYRVSPEENPTGPDSGTYRVIRGGSWNSPVDWTNLGENRLRTAWRDIRTIKYSDASLGFRCALVP